MNSPRSYDYTAMSPNIHYDVYWRGERKSNSQMFYYFTVKWNLKYSDSYLLSGFTLQVKADIGTGSSGWITYKENSTNIRGNGTNSFSFNVSVPSSVGGETLAVKFSFRNNNTNLPNYSSGSFTDTVVSLPLLVSACSAPTSISISGTTGSITRPTDKLTISWSGASGGNNNSISGYDVYVRCSANGSNPSESSYTYYKSVATSPLEITPALGDLTRGYTIKVGIRTKGSAGANYYSSYAYGGNLLVNTLPNKPSVNSLSFKSNITKTTLSVSAGSANGGFSGQDIYWAASETGTKTKYTTSTEFALGNQGTTKNYYFWTYDGYEYSSYTLAGLYRNLAPAISESSFTGTTCTVAGFSTAKNPVNTFSGSLKFNKSGLKCSINLKYGGLDLSSNSYSNLPNTVSNLSFGAVSGTTFSFANIDPRDYVPFGSTFAVNVVATDDVGESVSQWFSAFTNDADKKSLSVANFPTPVSPYYNNMTSGTTANHFYDKVQFIYSYDSYFASDFGSCFNSNVSGATSTVSGFTANGTSTFSVIVNTGKNLVSGSTYTFSNSISKKNRTSSVSTYSLVQAPVLNGTPKNTVSLRPFTDGASTSKTFTVSINNGSGSTTESTFGTYYDLDLTDWNWFKTYIKYGDKKELISESSTTGKTLSFSKSFANDYFNKGVAFSGSVIYDLLEKLNLPNKNSSYTLSIVNEITNRFGRTDSYEASVLTINYNEMTNNGLSITGSPAVKILYNSNLYDFPSTKDDAQTYSTPLAETLTLVFVPVVKTYNFEEYTYTIQKQSQNSSDWEDFPITDNERSFINNSGFGSPATIPFETLTSLLKVVLGEINSDKNCRFRVGIKIGSYPIVYSSPTIYFKRQKHTQTSIYLDNLNYENNLLKIKYHYGALGFVSSNFDSSYSKIWYEPAFSSGTVASAETDLFTNKTFAEWSTNSGETIDVSKSFSMTDTSGLLQSYAFVRLFLRTKVKTTYSLVKDGATTSYTVEIEKTSNSPLLTVYNSAQTIAYRQNHIGINTASFTDEDVLKVNATATRHNVIFESEAGQITLDIRNGKVMGFRIDCGEITS